MIRWIVVADSGRARLFSLAEPMHVWAQVHELEHEESREPSRAGRTTDAAGRTHQGTGWRGVRSAFDPHTPPDRIEHAKFAEEIAEYLEQALSEKKFDNLVLVAPPNFLGLLREKLGKHAAARVQACLNKDLVMLEERDIRERVLAEVSGNQGA
jgi:protein required for attachment to host cells